jgi:hypothetical protein
MGPDDGGWAMPQVEWAGRDERGRLASCMRGWVGWMGSWMGTWMGGWETGPPHDPLDAGQWVVGGEERARRAGGRRGGHAVPLGQELKRLEHILLLGHVGDVAWGTRGQGGGEGWAGGGPQSTWRDRGSWGGG